jgi:hypothetical protein
LHHEKQQKQISPWLERKHEYGQTSDRGINKIFPYMIFVKHLLGKKKTWGTMGIK